MISFIVISGGERPASIARLFESIEKQAIPDYEIIVVGRYDGPLPGKARLVNQPDLAEKAAICAMRNMGLDAAAGDPAILLDDDVELADGWYEAVKDGLASDFDVASCRVVTPAGDRWYDWAWASRQDPSCPTRNLDYGDTNPNVYVSGCFMAIRRKVFKKTRFNENLMNHQRDDVEFCHRVWDEGFAVSHFPEAAAIHHLDPAGRSYSDPASGSRQYSLGIDLLRKKLFREAFDRFEAAAATEGPGARYHAALCLKELEAFDQAIARFEAVIAETKDVAGKDPAHKRLHYTSWFHIGDMLQLSGQTRRAAECYRKVVDGFPEHNEAAARLKMISAMA